LKQIEQIDAATGGIWVKAKFKAVS